MSYPHRADFHFTLTRLDKNKVGVLVRSMSGKAESDPGQRENHEAYGFHRAFLSGPVKSEWLKSQHAASLGTLPIQRTGPGTPTETEEALRDWPKPK
jgi:hypothetical protein